MNESQLLSVLALFEPKAEIINVEIPTQRITYALYGDTIVIQVLSDHEILHISKKGFIITEEAFHEVSMLPARFTRTMQSFRVTFHIGKSFAVVKMFSTKGEYFSYAITKSAEIHKGFDKLTPSKLTYTSTDQRHALRLLYSKPRKNKLVDTNK
jgi:hypothetical protein